MAVSHPDATPLISNYVVHHARGRNRGWMDLPASLDRVRRAAPDDTWRRFVLHDQQRLRTFMTVATSGISSRVTRGCWVHERTPRHRGTRLLDN
jgi:hypothetical protein